MKHYFKIFNASKRKFDDNGFLLVEDCPVLLSGILEYLGSELSESGELSGRSIDKDKVYKVFIPESELKKSAPSFSLIPLVNGHEWLGVEGADAKDFQEGTSGENPFVEDGFLKVSLKFTGEEILKALKNGKEELSASYTNVLSWSDNPSYDLVASEIKANHIALVEKGRCGESVRVLNAPKLTYKTYLDLWCLKRTNYREFLKQYENVKRSLNEFHESDHPRDKDGQFSSKEEGNAHNKDRQKEIQKKINSVSIDFDKDNVLPELNKKELETFKSFGIDVKGKKVLFKKSTLDRNKIEHSDLSKEDYDKYIGRCLYSPEAVFRGNKDKPYFNMVTRIGDDKNSVVLLDLDLSKDNLEIVHFHLLRDKARKTLESKKT